jgi:hypothetical protein
MHSEANYQQKASSGSLDFNLISLFPPTWNDRPNGMRKDLMQAMKDLGPVSKQIPQNAKLDANKALDFPPLPRRKQP